MSFFTAQGAKFGADTLAANAVLLSFVMLIAHVLDGFAHALEALSGKSIGAKDMENFFRLVISAACLSFLVALCFSVFFYFVS